MKTRLWWVATLVLTLVLGGQLVAYRLQSESTLHASWIFHPKNMGEVRKRAQSIVLAEVVSVERGDDLVTTVPGEPNGEDRIPTQRVTLRVIKAYKGAAKKGDQLAVFQTGGTKLPPPPAQGEKEPSTNVQQFILEGDPLYQSGEQYLLMLEAGPNNMLRTIAPEGRYRVGQGGALEAMVDNDTTKEATSQSLTSVEKMLTSQ